MANDVITRKDIITDDAIKWGVEYVGYIDKAIAKNTEFVNALKVLNETTNKGRLTQNVEEFVEVQKKAKKVTEEVSTVWKEQIQLENQLASTKKKVELATEGTNRELAKQKILLQQQNQSVKQEAQNQLGLVSVYQKVQNKLNALGKEYNDLSIRKNLGAKLTNEEIKRYEFLEKKITTYDNALKLTDANQGKHHRNVGNYASGYNALGNSVNQLTREMPAFANSMNTGFMAISNNIPAFFDAIDGIKKKNIELANAGQPTKSVMSQLGGAIFSVQSLMAVGVTLLTVYGAELVEMAFGATEAEKAQKALADEMKHINALTTDQVVEMETLATIAQDTTLSTKLRQEAVKELSETIPELIGLDVNHAGAMEVLTKWTDIYIAGMLNRAKIEALVSSITRDQIALDETRSKAIQDRVKWTDRLIGGLKGLGQIGGAEAQTLSKTIARTTAEDKAAQKSIDDRIKSLKKLEVAQLDFDSKTKGGDKKEAKAKEPKRLQEVKDTTFELEKQRLERIISVNSEIAKNEEETDENRIEALEIVLATQNELIEESKNNQLKLLKDTYDKELKEGNKSKEGLIQLEKNYEADKKKVTEKASNDLVDIQDKTTKEILKIREFDQKKFEKSFKIRNSEIEKEKNKELSEAESAFNQLKSLGFKNDKDKENAKENHERTLFEIENKYAKKSIQLEIEKTRNLLDEYQKQTDDKSEDAVFIAELQEKLSKLELQFIKTNGDAYKENNDKKKTSSQEWIEENQEEIETTREILNELSNLTNAFSERKIQNLEAEIDKNNEFYDRQIELAGNDEKQKKALEKERELRNAETQKKINKEKEKQAKIDKAVAISQIAIQTALAIVKAAPNPFLIALTATLGAIQLATAIATPLPKYKDGRKGGKDEFAIVGDGGRPEIITDSQGNNPILTPSKDTLVHLNKGDMVHKSIEDFDRFRLNQLRKFGNVQNVYNDDKLVDEMRLTRKAIERQKLNVNLKTQKIDVSYLIWAQNNRRW